MAQPVRRFKDGELPREVRLDEVPVVVREGERGEDLRGTERGVARHERSDGDAGAVPEPEAADGDAGSAHDRGAAEDVYADVDVRVMHADGREHAAGYGALFRQPGLTPGELSSAGTTRF